MWRRPTFDTLKARIEACLVFEATVLKQGVRQEALRFLFPQLWRQAEVDAANG